MLDLLELLEQAVERLLHGVERATQRALELLSRYIDLIYRFLRNTFVNLLKIGWNLGKVFVFFLAPAYVASFGDELRRTNTDWWLWIVAWLLIVLGGAGAAIVVGTLMLAPFSSRRDPAPESEESQQPVARVRAGPMIFDVVSIAAVAAWSRFYPAYSFQSPLLRWTEEFARSLARYVTTLAGK